MNEQSELQEIRSQIDSIIERLDDVSFSMLRRATRENQSRPAADKTLMQARRALEKASRHLDAASENAEA